MYNAQYFSNSRNIRLDISLSRLSGYLDIQAKRTQLVNGPGFNLSKRQLYIERSQKWKLAL